MENSLTKWFALMVTGDIEYLGQHEDFRAAAESKTDPSSMVWLVDEAEARIWLDQLKKELDHAKPGT